MTVQNRGMHNTGVQNTGLRSGIDLSYRNTAPKKLIALLDKGADHHTAGLSRGDTGSESTPLSHRLA